MRRDALGAWGEERACELLKKNGLKIVERNYRCPSGEVDIIARDRKTLVFVEVKTRASEDYGEPSRAVDRAKQRHIPRTALYYIARHNWEDKPVRFDVVEVLPDEVRHIPDAFDGSALAGR